MLYCSYLDNLGLVLLLDMVSTCITTQHRSPWLGGKLANCKLARDQRKIEVRKCITIIFLSPSCTNVVVWLFCLHYLTTRS